MTKQIETWEARKEQLLGPKAHGYKSENFMLAEIVELRSALAAIGTSEPVKPKLIGSTILSPAFLNLTERLISGEVQPARMELIALIEAHLSEARQDAVNAALNADEWQQSSQDWKWRTEKAEAENIRANELRQLAEQRTQDLGVELRAKIRELHGDVAQVNKWRSEALETSKTLGEMWAEKVEKLEAELEATRNARDGYRDRCERFDLEANSKKVKP